jgi:hypothetical protein
MERVDYDGATKILVLSNAALSECGDVIRLGGAPFSADAAERLGFSADQFAETAAVATQTINVSTLTDTAWSRTPSFPFGVWRTEDAECIVEIADRGCPIWRTVGCHAHTVRECIARTADAGEDTGGGECEGIDVISLGAAFGMLFDPAVRARRTATLCQDLATVGVGMAAVRDDMYYVRPPGADLRADLAVAVTPVTLAAIAGTMRMLAEAGTPLRTGALRWGSYTKRDLDAEIAAAKRRAEAARAADIAGYQRSRAWQQQQQQGGRLPPRAGLGRAIHNTYAALGQTAWASPDGRAAAAESERKLRAAREAAYAKMGSRR